MKVSEFYGTRVKKLDLGVDTFRKADLKHYVEQRPAAIGVSLNVLKRGMSDYQRILLQQAVSDGTNLLIYDFLEDADRSLEFMGVENMRIRQPRRITGYSISGLFPALTLEFTGLKLDRLPALRRDYTFIDGSQDENNRIINTVIGSNDGSPIFLRYQVGSGNVFLLSTKQYFDLRKDPMTEIYTPESFSQLVPLMMFVKFAAGDKGWHRDADFANLTIDDPWLVEPYGNLNYKNLLTEMKKRDFHTTIAFIPWNFDRSQSEVVEIFRKNPRRFSIAIHGNDHDLNELSDRVPTSELRQDIYQSLTRMNEFKQRTNLPFSKVMVFPRKLGSIKALEILKESNFLATANARDLPYGARRPKDFDYNMRPALINYGGFPALQRRYVAPGKSDDRAVFDLFIDRPALLYGHHEDFSIGTGAFDAAVDQINSLAIKPKWQSLDRIAENLYLERVADDGSIKIKMYTNMLSIKNTSNQLKRYDVEKYEDFSIPIKAVTLDGKKTSFESNKKRKLITLSFNNPAGRSKQLAITYDGRADGGPISKTTNDSHVLENFTIRMLSDFRDIYIPRLPFGNYLIRATSGYGLRLATAFIVILLALLALINFRKRL